ncbi:MAG TPA: glycosyltransferase WbuB [Planctomycetaceae bacterium]|nr:glycosyltransferase WbuB [Planctomycetaceae bacterium]HIQ20395.1 glycosyltransferase WbuB [Planctomycetota bacterium]
MRIVYLHQYFTTPGMSGGTRSYEMARRLVQWGHDVHMVTSLRSGAGRGWACTVVRGIQVHWCPVAYSSHMGFNRRIRAFLQFSALAAERTARLPADVVFATSTPLTIALPAVYAAARRGIPMVFEVRDLWPETPIAVGALRGRAAIAAARWLERFAYSHADRVVALSPDMKAGVVRAGYPAERVTVIPNGCDLELFRVSQEAGRRFRGRFEWLGQRPLVVYAGALGIVNGVDYLARVAAAAWRINPEIRFLVVGDGCQRERVRREAEDGAVLGRNFFMLPPMAKSRIPAVFSAADIATSTVIDRRALWANSANKVFDALAAGRPVAINHEGWLAELIRQTGCGLVLDPHDIEGAARSLARALSDRRWMAAAGRAARRVAEERFDRDRLARRLESVLMDVVTPALRRKAA